MSVIDWIQQTDLRLFKLINIDGSVSWLNWFMLGSRNATTWSPLYAFLLYYTFRFNRKNALYFILLSLICFALTDFISASVIKPSVARLRPCHNELLKPIMHSLIDCGGLYSFPSSHASNHFGLASFWYFSIQFTSGKRWNWLWCWALLIGYAQVYVGKHYPFDILGGAIFGATIGWLIFRLYKYILERRKIISTPSAQTIS
jgi:undecaprenyl-diphosphatase